MSESVKDTPRHTFDAVLLLYGSQKILRSENAVVFLLLI